MRLFLGLFSVLYLMSWSVFAQNGVETSENFVEIDKIIQNIRVNYLGEKPRNVNVDKRCKIDVVTLRDRYVRQFEKNKKMSVVINRASTIERRAYRNIKQEDYCNRRDQADQVEVLEQLKTIDFKSVVTVTGEIAVCAPVVQAKAESDQRGTTHLGRMRMLQHEIDALRKLRFAALELSGQAAFYADKRDRLMLVMNDNVEICKQ